MSTTMTQKSLTEWLENRGWEVRSQKNLPANSEKGISLWALCPTGYVLSIQAGFGIYSDPHEKSKSYTKVEIAIWERNHRTWDKKKDSKFIKDIKITEGHSTANFIGYNRVVNTVYAIESWKDGKGPQINIKRDPVWR